MAIFKPQKGAVRDHAYTLKQRRKAYAYKRAVKLAGMAVAIIDAGPAFEVVDTPANQAAWTRAME